MLLSHSKEGVAEALFVDKREAVHSLSIVLDERICSDTVLRVTQVAPMVYIVCDIHTLNGKNVFDGHTFSQRKSLLSDLLDAFHAPDLVALVLPEDAPHGTLLRGHETYDDNPGTTGVFLPAVE